MSKSDYLEAATLDHQFGIATYNSPATVYVALFTSDPTDADAGTEAAYTGYDRVAVTNNGAGWSRTGSEVSNTNVVTFPECDAAHVGDEVITHFGIYDAGAAGNLLWYAALDSPETINANKTPKFNPGALTFTED